MVSAQGGCAAGPLQRPVFSPFARRMAARAAVESKRTPIKSRRAGSGCILLHLCQRTHMFTVQPFHGQMARTPATGFVARCPSGIPVRGRLWAPARPGRQFGTKPCTHDPARPGDPRAKWRRLGCQWAPGSRVSRLERSPRTLALAGSDASDSGSQGAQSRRRAPTEAGACCCCH